MANKIPKRLLYSLCLALIWLSFVAEGSHALFSDKSSLTGSIITTGTVDLLVSNSQNGSSTTYADTRPGFSYNLVPGQSDERYILLKNASASDVPMDIDIDTVIKLPITDLAASVNLEFTPVDADGNPTGSPVSGQMNTLVTTRLSSKISIASGATQRFRLKTTLANGYTGQNSSLTYDLFFTGTQHLGS